MLSDTHKVVSLDCPYCDSKDAFVYKTKDKEMFLCFDCQRHVSFHKTPAKEKQVTKSHISFNPILSLCTKLSDLPSDHFCVQYVKRRKISEKFKDKLFFTEKFDIIAKNIGKEAAPGPRLVIPFFDKEGKLFAMQGRALDDSKIRYVTLVFDRNDELLFGVDRVDLTKPFVVVEGPIDSLFLENAVATAGIGNVSDKYLSLATICLDNEPRNKDIVRIIKKNIERGFKVVIWPDNIKQKDINDMYLEGINVAEVIEKNTFKNLNAMIRLNDWKKI
jgi:hypothetical protein